MAVTPIAGYQDFLDRVDNSLLIRLTDQYGTGSPDQSKVELAASDATDFIYGQLGRKYALPPGSIPSVLVRICVTIGIWYLGMSSANGAGLGDDWQAAYDQAVQMLQDIASGNVSLGEDDPQETGSRDAASYTVADRVFTRDKMRSW